ncbi:MAG: hypothetical protein JWP44_5098 [Mucilaginibacter sp.]|nr:hypothetical protein [Mucilaginibacter sp.]
MRKLLLVLPLLLSACGTVPISVPQIVKVPVKVFCKTTPVPKPSMPFDEQATPIMNPRLKAILFAAQEENLKGYSKQLEGALAGCSPPPGEPTFSITQPTQ